MQRPPELPQLTGMTTGGELVRADVYDAFVNRYGVRLGNMYGMTEVGVIATDLFGEHRPAVLPAPGLAVREEGGELHIALPASPYLGDAGPGPLVGRLAAHQGRGQRRSRQTGLVRVLGRRDSQVSVGGLKVDLTEVEHTLAALPEVAGAVVVHDHAIEAYLVLAEGAEVSAVEREITTRLAPYKRPRRLHVVEQLPRTATGKLVRDQAVTAQRRTGPPSSRKEAPTMIDEIRQFVLDSLTDMNYSIDGIDDDTALGPAGADLESLALAELAVRVEDHFGVQFDDDESETLAGMTVGEFCRDRPAADPARVGALTVPGVPRAVRRRGDARHLRRPPARPGTGGDRLPGTGLADPPDRAALRRVRRRRRHDRPHVDGHRRGRRAEDLRVGSAHD